MRAKHYLFHVLEIAPNSMVSGLRAVEDVLKPSGSLLLIDLSKAVILV